MLSTVPMNSSDPANTPSVKPVPSVYVSKPNQSVVLAPSALLDQLFPGAVRLPDARVVLPHTLGTWRTLHTHGINVPHPLSTYYDWAGGSPFHTQKMTAQMLVNNRRAYVLNDMGTGKTRAALWAWDYLYSSGNARKLLVVCPLSVTKFGWAAEIFRTLKHRKAVVVTGNRTQRQLALSTDADIYIINHDGVKVVGTELAQHPDIDSIVIDELAVYRNGQTVRNKQMRMLAAPMKWVWGLTGGPMPNEPTDVWGQCKIITPNSVPKYFTHFQDRLMRKIDQYRYIPRPDAVENAFQVMQPSVRYTLDDVTELPPVIERFIDVPLTHEQETLYKQLMVVFQTMIREHKITAANAAVAMTKLLQISAGWVYAQDTGSVKIDAGPRIEVLLDLIDECKRKVIVFAPFRHIVQGLGEIFTKSKIEHAVVHGDTPRREVIFNDFQNTERFKVLLAHPKCMAHGLTLTAADTIIWYCPITSNETYLQADARIRRVGQEHKQQIIHLQGTPVERKVYQRLHHKQQVQANFLELFTDVDLNGSAK